MDWPTVGMRAVLKNVARLRGPRSLLADVRTRSTMKALTQYLPIDRFALWLRAGAAPLAEADLSRAISVARIVLIAGLVFLHFGAFPSATVSPFDGMNPAIHPVATFVNSFVLFFFFSAVPLLSMVSGWLYFTFDDAQAAGALRERITRRLGSLYLPLVFWNALYLFLAVLLLAFWPGSPVLGEFNIDPLESRPARFFNAVFAITHHPIAFQFWFVRDLLVTVLISPLLWFALRHAPYIGAAALGLSWLAGNDLGIFFRADVALFFYLGGLVRMRRLPLEIGPRAGTILLMIYIVLVALRAMAPAFMDITPNRPELLDVATRAMRLIGVLACWSVVCRLAATASGRNIARYGGLSFFLFATHFPMIAAAKHLLWPLLPVQNDFWMIVHYVTSVALTVLVGLSLAMVFARFAPKIFALMNGGREIPIGRAQTQVKSPSGAARV